MNHSRPGGYEGRKEKEMKIFRENKETGLSCGINDDGDLFLGDDKSGYNLPDTPYNRERVMADFDFWNSKNKL